MHYILYNPNSKGGNYKYAHYTAQALSKNGAEVSLVLPKNGSDYLALHYPINKQEGDLKPNNYKLKPILLTDQPNAGSTLLKKLHFILRIHLNPIIFWWYLIKQPASKVIFNDFDQASALLWVPLYKFFLRKHYFSIILHDPDRDAYPGGVKHSQRCMKAIMGLMDVAFYHEQLPNKVYYNHFKGKKVSIPHGIYPPAPADTELTNKLLALKGERTLLCIPGNIRMEKNYFLIIESLAELSNCMLLIAGAPSSSSVDMAQLKILAKELGIEDRIIWYTQYLSDEEFTSVIQVSDLILLYYKSSFTSQSGILNQIAPLKKNVIISDTQSALSKLALEYNIGTLVNADNKPDFIAGVKKALQDKEYQQHWDKYLEYASWEEQSKLIAGSSELGAWS